MGSNDSDLSDLPFVMGVLKPIECVAWGDIALGHLGVRTVISDYMLGVADNEMALAAEKLIGAGFQEQSWSLGSLVDPETRKDDEAYYNMHMEVAMEFKRIDTVSRRFAHAEKCSVKTVLIPLSYLRLSPPNAEEEEEENERPAYYANRWVSKCDNLYFTNPSMLLESIIHVTFDNDSEQLSRDGYWRGLLDVWAMGYLYGMLNLRDDILDTCKDERVRTYFNEEVKKAERGHEKEKIKNKIRRPLLTNELIAPYQR